MSSDSPTIEQLIATPQNHLAHYSNLADFHASAQKHAATIERALGDIWKANDGMPYLERQLEEARNSIVIEKLGEPNSFNVGYIATVKRIGELMDQIFAKKCARSLARKQLEEAMQALQATWNLISSWYVETANDPAT
jgi:hypothetical protein